MNKLLLSLLLVPCLALAGAAHAQTSRGGGSGSTNTNAQAMQQLQQLASERTQLQAENAKLKQQLDELQKKLKAVEAEKGALSARAQNSSAAIARAGSQTGNLEQTIAQQRTRMEELVGKFREMATTLETVETERTTVGAQLTTRDQELKACVDKNHELLKINGEILDRLEKPGLLSSLARREPFTQIKRTRLENLVDEYRGKAEDQRVVQPVAVPLQPGVTQSTDAK